MPDRSAFINRRRPKIALYKSFKLLDNSGLRPELSTMRTPWTLSTIEARDLLRTGPSFGRRWHLGVSDRLTVPLVGGLIGHSSGPVSEIR
jgi:hypothetical protein